MAAHALAWFTVDHLWLLVGLLGQGLFASRFIIQWFKSEMEGRSVIPVTFWYFSVIGGVVLLAYHSTSAIPSSLSARPRG